MAGFQNTLPDNRVNDFWRATKEAVGKDLTDTITPDHPTFKKLEKNGCIRTEEPGRNIAEDILYATPDREVVLSKSVDFQPVEQTPVEAATRVFYEWMMVLNYLVVGTYEYKNATTLEGFAGLLSTKMKAVRQGAKNKMVQRLWNGFTNGSEKLFGLTDAIRFDPSVDPSRGAIGGISVASLPGWTNNSKAFGAAYKTTGGGGQITSTFLDGIIGSNEGLRKVFRDCSNNGDGETPDLIAMNEVGDTFCANLAFYKLLFKDETKNLELGVDGFDFMGATMYFDRDAPAENDAEGTFYLLNTKSFNVNYASGLTEEWGDLIKLQGQTAFQAEMSTQWTLSYKDLRRLGVLYDVRAS